MVDAILRVASAKRLSFTDGKMFLEGICVVAKDGDKFVSKFPSFAALDKIAHLLEIGQTAKAIFLANFTLEVGKSNFQKTGFDEAEPRNAIGEWATSNPEAPATIQDVQYRGYFHDLVVDDLIKGLNRHGGVAIAQVKVFGVNGILAIADGASLPAGWNRPYFIEVKTGFDSDFTPNQQQVYALICEGGHAVSFDPRIAQLGLTPGALLPPMDIMVAHTYGPGLPISFHSYCRDLGYGGSQ